MLDCRFHINICLLSVLLTATIATGCKKKNPTSNPTPAPTATPRTDLSASCRRVAEGTAPNNLNTCRARGSGERWKAHLLSAMDAQREKHGYGPANMLVRDPRPWADDVVAFLDQQHNLCTFWDGQRFLIRNSEGTNEYYRGFNNYKQFYPLYMTTCTPAEKFPTRDDSKDPHKLDPYCSLPASRASSSEHPPTTEPRFRQELFAALDEIEAEERANPDIMVYKDAPGWKYWVKPGKAEIYQQLIAEKLRKRGVCAASWDAQGISIKRDNTYSEFWATYVLGQEDGDGNHPVYRNFHSTYGPAHF